MKNLLVSAAAATVLTLSLSGQSFAQRAVSGGYGEKYDAHTVWTVSGEVMSVDKVARDGRGYHGVHLLLKTAKGELSVHLGPSWFVDHQTVQVARHDVIEVIGSPMIYDGKPALIAAEVDKGNQSLRLRTANGLPLWRGSGAR